jgi:purine-binding chemotaxis protein CheW
LPERVLALRREFDASFALEPTRRAEDVEDLLALRVGGDPHALSLVDVAELHVDKKIVPLPSSVPELLGMTAFRNVIAPVYDLGALLGYPHASGWRWLVLLRAHDPVGLAFQSFEGHVRVPRAEVLSNGSDSAAAKHVRGVIRWDGTRPIVDVLSLLSAIKKES